MIRFDLPTYYLLPPTENSSRGNVIVIREPPTTSSSESNFTDPESPTKTFNLTITKLEQLDLISDLPTLQVVRHESVSFDGEASVMPIVKKKSENGTPENGIDKGIFSVSRVKKVELPEIPLATDICQTRKFR